MAEDWEGYWKRKTILTRIVDFMRINYFADIPISYLGDLDGKTVLEAGCGTSESLVRIAKKAKKVVGIDISQKALDRSKVNFEKVENLRIFCVRYGEQNKAVPFHIFCWKCHRFDRSQYALARR